MYEEYCPFTEGYSVYVGMASTLYLVLSEGKHDHKHDTILLGVVKGCTLSPNLFKIYIDDLITAVEATRQGVTGGEGTESGLMFVDDFVGASETPEGLEKQIEKVLEYTRKWRDRRTSRNAQ